MSWAPWSDWWDGWRRQPGRAGLVLIAIGVGTAALVILFAVLGGLTERMRTVVHDFGANVAAVAPAPGSATFTPSDTTRLQAAGDGALVSRIRRARGSLRGVKEPVDIVATDETLRSMKQWPVTEGRWLDPLDCRGRQRHAVISRSLLDRWPGGVGDVLVVQQVPFRVVGIVETAGSGGAALPRALAMGAPAVFVPHTVAPTWETSGADPRRRLDALLVRPPRGAPTAGHLARWSRALRGGPGGESALQWTTSAQLIENLRRWQRLLHGVVAAVAVICLGLGGITLVSLMVAGVRERVPEIGLRLAVGATPRAIGLQFLGESAVLCAAGSLTGALAGCLLLFTAGTVVPVPVHLSLAALVVPVAAGIAVGVLFAWFPARLAARITPSEALRNP